MMLKSDLHSNVARSWDLSVTLSTFTTNWLAKASIALPFILSAHILPFSSCLALSAVGASRGLLLTAATSQLFTNSQTYKKHIFSTVFSFCYYQHDFVAEFLFAGRILFVSTDLLVTKFLHAYVCMFNALRLEVFSFFFLLL